MKRRDFLKTTAIAGTAVSISPLRGGASYAGGGRSKVVIAKDTQCLPSAGSPDEERIQDMVDHAIMELTGNRDKTAAYRAIFPEAVSSSTRVVLKINQSVDNTSRNASFRAVYEAFESGLNSIGITNVTTLGSSNTAASSNPQFSMGSTSFRIVDAIAECDYFINIPGCWATSASMAGVTMNLKNMMGAVSGSRGNMHSLFASSTTPALSILNNQEIFKEKQVLCIIAAIQIRSDSGPGGSPNNTAHSIIVSRDMVAADYQGMLILKEYDLTSDRETVAREVFDLAAQSPYNIGVADPANMDVVNIAPPWDTKVTWSGRNVEKMGLRVIYVRRNNRPHIVFKLNTPHLGSPRLTIFSMGGSKIWTSPRLEWNGETLSGGTAGPGPYLYAVTAGRRTVRGHIMIGR
ncbi:MAG: DUF362 domain-containing protein [Chitinispirillaceae bacterium]|nr:DUF362 domain-containing protein [Chitinispirillaceae bacterium]